MVGAVEVWVSPSSCTDSEAERKRGGPKAAPLSQQRVLRRLTLDRLRGGDLLRRLGCGGLGREGRAHQARAALAAHLLVEAALLAVDLLFLQHDVADAGAD